MGWFKRNLGSFGEQIEKNYEFKPWQWMLGAMPGVKNTYTALAEQYGQVFSKMDARKSQQQERERQDAAVNRQMAEQRHYAENGIRMRVADAKAAGIHPIYALGAGAPSYSPVSSVGGGGDIDSGHLSGLFAAGQDIGRAFAKTRTAEERQMGALALASAQADLTGKELDNRIRLRELQKMELGTPAFPSQESFIEGQGNSGAKIKTKAMERTASFPGRPDIEAGAKTGVGFYVTDDGGLVPVPSKDTKESIEDNLIQETAWAFRNNLLPNITGGAPPPGYYWDIKRQAYYPYDWKKRFDPKDTGLRKRPRPDWHEGKGGL